MRAPEFLAILATVVALTSPTIAAIQPRPEPAFFSRSAPPSDPGHGPGVLYVDDSSTNGLNDGSSWEHAYVHLQDALARARSDNSISEIWVAEGVHKPDQGQNHTLGDRLASFGLWRASIYGGFAGTEASIDQRQPAAHPTILSGDLKQNDYPRDMHSTIDNSVHVVTGAAAHVPVLVDGVVIRGGSATWGSIYGAGGGASIGNYSEVMFRHCIFEDNAATFGGAMSIGEASVSAVACIFRHNRALGLYWDYPYVGFGGAIASGGYAGVVVTNCLFDGNMATGDGGAIYAQGVTLTLVNSTLTGNAAYRDGGGVFIGDSYATVSNCILWANRGAEHTGESAQLHTSSHTALEINYSCLEGWTGFLGGTGNIAADPLFIFPARPPLDWLEVSPFNRNVRSLMAGSPAIDAGDNLADTDPYLEGLQAIPPFDLDGLPRFHDHTHISDTGNGDPPVVDMGTFEFQPQDCNRNGVQDDFELAAGTSIDCDQSGVPDECEIDCNHSGIADACDLAYGSSLDCNHNSVPDECEPDCNRNHIEDECDIADGTSADCNATAVPDECDPPASLQAELRGSEPMPDYHLGWSAAMRGDLAILGSIDGTASIFRRGSLGWTEDAILSDPGGWHFDAVSVAVGENVAVVGAPLIHHANLDLEGAAYVFRKRASGWIQEAELVMTADGEESDFFGSAVAISGDMLVVGSHGWDDGGYATGAAYVFRYAPLKPGWVLEAKLVSPSSQTRTFFGSRVSASNDTILVGALGEWSGGIQYGAAHVFRRDNAAGGTWLHEARLTPSINSSYHQFGSAVAVDGELALVGATVDHYPYSHKSGRAFVFRRPATRNTWAEEAMLTPNDPFPGDRFGAAVAVSGGTILVGAEGNNDPPYNAGAAYLFQFDGSEWIQAARLTAPDPRPWNSIGSSVALDGNRALVGAAGRNSALVYSLEGDCNHDGVLDSCEIATETESDCDSNGRPDGCEEDCNANGYADSCEVAAGTATDCDSNGRPDDCQPDCNVNGVSDSCDISTGNSADCNHNSTPDDCERDCNNTGITDDCELTGDDCNANYTPDECDLSSGQSADCNLNAVPDECDIAEPNSIFDCNSNGVPDGCDLAAAFSDDCDSNGIPDECQAESCRSIWDGFEPSPPFYLGAILDGLDYDGDGIGWNAPSWAGVVNGGCPSAGRAIRAYLYPELDGDYVLSEPFPTRHEGAWRQSLTFDIRRDGGSRPRTDWQLSLRDEVNGQAVILLHWASTQSNFPGVATAAGGNGQGRILVQNPATSPAFINTGFTVPHNTCCRMRIVFDNSSGVVELFVNDVLRATTMRLEPAAARMDYFKLEQKANGQTSGSTNVWIMDSFELCTTGGGLGPGGLVDCNANGVLDRCDIDSGTSRDCNANALPDECEGIPRADLDCDGDVDPADFAAWRACHPLPGRPTPAGCDDADLNRDGRVDCADWRILRDAWTTGTPPSYPRCRPASGATPSGEG